MNPSIYKQIVEHSTDAIIVTEAPNPDNLQKPRILFVNNAYEKMTGYPREEVLGKTPHILQGPKTADQELDKLRDAIKNNRPGRAELINYKKNGDEFWSSISIFPIEDEKENTQYWIGIKRDITHLKQQKKRANTYRKVLFQLATDNNIISGENIGYAITEILKKSSQALGISRSSFWIIDNDVARCQLILENGNLKKPDNYIFQIQEHNNYFTKLKNKRVLAVTDALGNNQYGSLTETYLRPHDICSFINTSVRVSGKINAVLSFSQQNTTRNWDTEDENFVGGIADLVTQVFVNTENRKKEVRLRESLQEKEVLLQEVHHRVKNNLAVLSSLLELQIMNEANELIKDRLRSTTTRIFTIASIHELLYQSNSLSSLNLAKNIEELAYKVTETLGRLNDIAFNMTLPNISLNINQAIPCSLIISEVLTAIMKQHTPSQKQETIDIQLMQNDPEISLCIENNSSELPVSFEEKRVESLGMQLIDILTQQLEGEFNLENTDRGIFFNLRFDRKEVQGAHSAIG